MRDTDLYRELLGIVKPWTVDRVELLLGKREVHVHLADAEARWPCPECGEACGLHDHVPERVWRHLDSCHCRTLLHARVPRVDCSEHGVREVRVPWAEPKSRFTAMFERFAIDVLHETSISGAADLLGISWGEAHTIQRRAVERGLARRPHTVPRHLGVDEKSIAKGHVYATVTVDLDRGAVLEVTSDRTMESLWKALGAFSMNELGHVEAIAMDMSPVYWSALQQCVPDADTKIVFDRFHVAQHGNDAVDKVRRQESKALAQLGDERLVGTSNMWRYREEHLPERYQVTFDALRSSGLRTARAWAIKEQLGDLWDQPTRADGVAWYKRWYGWAIRSRLEPVKKLAGLVKSHLEGILNYFTHRITNAGTEAINGVIQMLNKRSFGYRNFDNFRAAILFHCGKLDLYPATP